jgi:hypothetical protein
MTPFDHRIEHVSFRMTQRHMPASEEGLRQLREAIERLSPNTLIADGAARNEVYRIPPVRTANGRPISRNSKARPRLASSMYC